MAEVHWIAEIAATVAGGTIGSAVEGVAPGIASSLVSVANEVDQIVSAGIAGLLHGGEVSGD